MSTPRRELKVWINEQQVGTLASQDDIWRFQYSPSWQAYEENFALAPVFELRAEEFVDGSDMRSVQWYFDNLLPEEQLRNILAREAHIAEADAFGLLEYYGAESAGSLVLSAGEALTEKGWRELRWTRKKRSRANYCEVCPCGWPSSATARRSNSSLASKPSSTQATQPLQAGWPRPISGRRKWFMT